MHLKCRQETGVGKRSGRDMGRGYCCVRRWRPVYLPREAVGLRLAKCLVCRERGAGYVLLGVRVG